MTIWISSLAEAPGLVLRHTPSHVISLLSPYDAFPKFAGFNDTNHLKVPIHDIAEDVGDWQAPAHSDAEKVIHFAQTWDRSAPMLIHCWAGISRSTASAFITACIHNPTTDEAVIAQAIRTASISASPNVRLVAHADDILGRNGRMITAIAMIGRGDYSNGSDPFFIPADFCQEAEAGGAR